MLKPETVRWLQWALQRGGFSRAGLARELCERDGWRNPRGKLCAASARKALPRLAKLGGVAGPHGGLAAQQAAALSRQRVALEGIRAFADDGAGCKRCVALD